MERSPFIEKKHTQFIISSFILKKLNMSTGLSVQRIHKLGFNEKWLTSTLISENFAIIEYICKFWKAHTGDLSYV